MTDKKRTVLGVLAHVDAGKTTLCEAMLYLSGQLKKPGRVDHRDSFLDTHSLERERGITIFSKQAILPLGEGELTLLDTPGHVDFSAETERTLPVLDCALLVVSGTDGVQAHTETLWRLLERYGVPCFVFVTKTDLPGCGEEERMAELRARLDENCLNFTSPAPDQTERLAMCSESAMEKVLSTGALDDGDLREMIARRELFPCFFGSGLKLEGVEALLEALERYAPACPDRGTFAAKVYKISRDAQGRRLTWLNVTGGSLKVRAALGCRGEDGELREEKITQLRRYSGEKFETPEALFAGQTAAVTGLTATWPGQGLGAEPDSDAPVLEPVLSYRLILPEGLDPAVLLPKLRQLDEEDPQLRVLWNERLGEISVQLMGRVQAEVFVSLVRDRFEAELKLDTGRILYRETIAAPVEGVGHFEPLRHYAEVHLLLEPLPRGSGLVLDSAVGEDVLDRNWQRLILTHLAEKQHPGVLTGSPITDMKITLAAGRAHLKHTEGGDFREATYRAVRQGLMQAGNVLLEPWYAFRIEVPPEQIGRAISDVRAMNGVFGSPTDAGDLLCLKGSAPVAAMNGYMEQLVSYSRGRGRLSLRPDGYRECREQERAVAAIGYDPEGDTENPADSVFCAHGGGFRVRWDRVKDYMHLESCLQKPETPAPEAPPAVRRGVSIDERELEAIMEREFGPIRRPEYRPAQRNEAPPPAPAPRKKAYVIVDGYNLIFAWEELKKLASERLDLARGRLMDMLSSYCGYTKAELVLVFDGYRMPGNPGERGEYHNIRVVYTADGETGDAYIERLADEIGKNYDVRVVTSDNLIRLSALRSGVLRESAKEFAAEVQRVQEQIGAVLRQSNRNAHTTKLTMERKDGKP